VKLNRQQLSFKSAKRSVEAHKIWIYNKKNKPKEGEKRAEIYAYGLIMAHVVCSAIYSSSCIKTFNAKLRGINLLFLATKKKYENFCVAFVKRCLMKR
jgi:hypothetical protein